MNKIIVYEHPDFRGLSMEFTDDIQNLVQKNFDNCISSVKVIGQPWVLYEHLYYKGLEWVYEEGEYSNVSKHDTVSSLRLITEDLHDPKITLYEHPNYKGKEIVLTCEANLCYGSFNDMASSHIVQKGAWLLYEHSDRGGRYITARDGERVPDYGVLSFHDRVSHLRPLKPGKGTVTAEVFWEKKEEKVKSFIIDSICGLNPTDHEQTFSTSLSKEYAATITENFSFNNSTTISAGATFSVDVFKVKNEFTLSVSNTFTVEKGKSESHTETKKVNITLPATIRPHTKLSVSVIRKEVDVKLPVKLTLTQGKHSVIEYGEYRCQSGLSLQTEYKEEKIEISSQKRE
ncbi:epidermal differentiation-specific protein-like [Acipenser oxyrinchus oxyrinchus]|uniref:Epidermal differentiation-specific protein-like n=1 Tax=Acipenser oxyrinchus oxyrinchus TaxID=40147 RepID=A0AAD8CI41_ACIOX|nr:epidermal differentiation-specific protein-like [Acipenser oxyrinchus oxyrinchus]